MSGLKAIRRRLTSVKNTKQITRAMKLVSAAKLKKAQDAALGGRKFSERLGGVLSLAIAGLPEDFKHPLIETRQVGKRVFVVFSGDRGLCGAYNSNITKAVAAENKASKADNLFYAVGRKAEGGINRFQLPLVKSFVGLPEDASLWPMSELGNALTSSYASGEVDEVVLVYTKFISTMTLEVVSERLLPFSVGGFSDVDAATTGTDKKTEVSTDSVKKVKVEPTPEMVFTNVLPLLLKTKLYQAAFEAKACEHAARMTAMDSATRNADELMDKLKLFYNRARQRVITAELLDILGGAEAQKG